MRHQRWIQWMALSSLILVLAACAASAEQEAEQTLSAAADQGEQTAVVTVAPEETSAPTPEPTTVEDSSSSMPDSETAVITTANSGEFVVASAYITPTVRDSAPQHENAAFLVISLTRPDGTVPNYENLSLETFENEQTDLEIEFLDPTAVDAAAFPFLFEIADNRFITICDMGGWLDEAFVQVCTIPNVAAEYSLVWAGNPPILITPDGVE